MNAQEIGPANDFAPRPGPEQRTAKRKNRTEFTWADALMPTIAVFWILPEIVDLIAKGTISSRLSPAIEGGLHLADLEAGPQSYFIVALALKFIALLATVFFVTRALGDMANGRVFTERNSRRFLAGMTSIFVYAFARLGLEGMANNYASAQLGIDWWHDPGTTTPLSDLAPALILAVVFGALATILRRGEQLEEDVDGLV